MASEPRTRSSISLVKRLTRVNLLVLSITMSLTFILIATISWLVARDYEARSTESEAQLLANSLAPMLVFQDAAAAKMELAVLSHRDDMVKVQIFNLQKSKLNLWLEMNHDPSGLSNSCPYTDELLKGERVQCMSLNSLCIWFPIKLKNEVVGALFVHQSLYSLQIILLRMVLMAVGLIILAIFVASRLLRWVQRRVLAPIVELSNLAERISLNQDYSQRVQVHYYDEVGRLSERFNQMLKRVEISQAELNRQVHREQEVGQKFEKLAHQDSLTQLPNRLYFQSTLQLLIEQSCRENSLMALMFIDLDSFKMVNDRYGHDTGDLVLCEVARRMSSVLRDGDVLCRLGGDEFGLILPMLPDEAAAEQLALRLIACIREPMVCNGHKTPIGATIGLAFCPTNETEASKLLNAADIAMYAAKRDGKNTFRRAAYVTAV
jgi:diguanylate cyclase (GGDEF)-like protein